MEADQTPPVALVYVSANLQCKNNTFIDFLTPLQTIETTWNNWGVVFTTENDQIENNMAEAIIEQVKLATGHWIWRHCPGKGSWPMVYIQEKVCAFI